MEIRLQSGPPNTISAYEMLDGDIGVIVSWPGTNTYDNLVVQRYNNSLIRLGKNNGYSWSQIPDNKECRIRILTKGETLIIG